ncbi:MAG TPA: hypothetical protein VMZ30_19730 [Pyrinomonadaceae bacterium]|nr:hypothetical protein [Pyrinomonadaceae bacterium]
MKIIGGNRFALQADNDEIATATVTATGTAFLVTYRVVGGHVIDGPNEGSLTEGVPLQIKLDGSTVKKNTLSLNFVFATEAQAAGEADEGIVEYEVEVTGDAAGSDVSKEFVDGSFGIPTDNRQWRFFVG